jgi:CheY-like chemotaxis protein
VASLERALSRGHAHCCEQTVAPLRLVIADDDPIQRRLTTIRLSRLGFDVHAASDGPSALALARAVRADGILSDVVMPGMDGLELCARARADPELDGVRVVLVTGGLVEDRDRELAERAGAAAYLYRSHDFDELAEAIRALLAPVE